MTDDKARTEAIKKRLITLVDTALGVGTVTGEGFQSIDFNNLDNLPLVSIKLENIRDVDVAYGRRMTTTAKGNLRYYRFSLNVIASACRETGESPERYVHQHSDAIVSYLRSKRMNSTEVTDYGIWDFPDLLSRESEINAEELRHMIIDGTVEVEFLD